MAIPSFTLYNVPSSTLLATIDISTDPSVLELYSSLTITPGVDYYTYDDDIFTYYYYLKDTGSNTTYVINQSAGNTAVWYHSFTGLNELLARRVDNDSRIQLVCTQNDLTFNFYNYNNEVIHTYEINQISGDGYYISSYDPYNNSLVYSYQESYYLDFYRTLADLNAELEAENTQLWAENINLKGSAQALGNTFELIGDGIESTTALLDLKIAPNISVGMIATVPLVCAVLLFLVKSLIK